MPENAHSAWAGKTDGTPWMQRTLIRLYRFLPLWLLYGVMALVIPFYIVFDGNGRRSSWNFFRKRLEYPALKSAVHVYLNMFNMGMVVLDRFAAYAGKKFKINADGLGAYEELCGSEEGFVVMSSHVGNYEMVGYTLKSPKHSNVLVYAGETATIMSNRTRLFTRGNVTMVPASEDLSHVFLLNSALGRGEIVSLPSDRVLGSSKTVKCRFMGADASFPAGPFTLALAKESATVAFFNVKTGIKSYKIIVRPLTTPQGGSRQERLQALAQAFATEIEYVVRAYPDQWYNFYDFWA